MNTERKVKLRLEIVKKRRRRRRRRRRRKEMDVREITYQGNAVREGEGYKRGRYWVHKG